MAGGDPCPIFIGGHAWYAVRGTHFGPSYSYEHVVMAGGCPRRAASFATTAGYGTPTPHKEPPAIKGPVLTPKALIKPNRHERRKQAAGSQSKS